MDWSELFEPESMDAMKAWSFPVWYFFECQSEWINVYIHLKGFLRHFETLFFKLFSIFVMISPFLYFVPKSFCLLCIRVHTFSPYFFWLFQMILFCLYCLVLSRYLFSLLSFTSTFWFISLSCTFCCSCDAFSSLFQHLILFFCLIIFVCCCRCLFCVSNMNSHPGLVILFFRKNLTFSKTSFGPA